MLASIAQSRSLNVHCTTWNHGGHSPPSPLTPLFASPLDPPGEVWRPRHHVYAVGSEECERGIVASMLIPGAEEKTVWEGAVSRTLGDEYIKLASQGLGATHLAVFIHRDLRVVVSNVVTGKVATGLGNTLANKGGVAIGFSVGGTSFLFVNCHLAAGQKHVKRRNADWARIDARLGLTPSTLAVEGRIAMASTTASISVASAEEQVEAVTGGEETDEEECDGQGESESVELDADTSDATASSKKPAASLNYDRCVWMGDLNYRISSDRASVDALLQDNNLDFLLTHDQLLTERQHGRAGLGFAEGPLTFRPSYKFDVGGDLYDTGKKRRVPAWTDRILFRTTEGSGVVGVSSGPPTTQIGMDLLSYRSVDAIKTSDHRPVVAEFQVVLGGISRGRSSSLTCRERSSSLTPHSNSVPLLHISGSGSGVDCSSKASSEVLPVSDPSPLSKEEPSVCGELPSSEESGKRVDPSLSAVAAPQQTLYGLICELFGRIFGVKGSKRRAQISPS
jgi:hypothetical protein